MHVVGSLAMSKKRLFAKGDVHSAHNLYVFLFLRFISLNAASASTPCFPAKKCRRSECHPMSHFFHLGCYNHRWLQTQHTCSSLAFKHVSSMCTWLIESCSKYLELHSLMMTNQDEAVLARGGAMTHHYKGTINENVQERTCDLRDSQNKRRRLNVESHLARYGSVAQEEERRRHQPQDNDKGGGGGTARPEASSSSSRCRLVYVAHRQGHLYEIWLGGRRELQVTFFRGRERTLTIAEELLLHMQKGGTKATALEIRKRRYLQASMTRMTHQWDARILADHDAATQGREWKGEISPGHSRLCRFA